jgi:hypothetical protein
MAIDPNPLPGPRTDFFDGSGHPTKGPETMKNLGGINRAWLLYFKKLGTAGTGGSGGTTPPVGGVTNDFLIDLLLSTGLTTIASPQTPNNGQLLTVILRQGPAGGRRIAWGAGFSAAVTDIDTTGTTISVFQFCGSGGLWVMCQTPTSGLTPSDNTPSGTSHNASPAILLDLGLTGAGPVTIASPGTVMNGEHFYVILRQTVGGTTIAWDATFSTDEVDIATEITTATTFEYIGSNNFWVMCGAQVTGIPYTSAVGSGTPITGLAVNVLLDQTLTTGSTTINSPLVPTDAQRLTVILRQDATGGRLIAWDSNFDVTQADIDPTGLTISSFKFVGSGGKWIGVGQPMTGATP